MVRHVASARRVQPEPLIKATNGEWIDGSFHRHELRYRITSAGRYYYEQEWARYRELYPAVEAPAPKVEL